MIFPPSQWVHVRRYVNQCLCLLSHVEFFLILRRSDSSGEQGGEHVRINSKVIPVTNEWGAVGSGGERDFLAPSSHSINEEVILVCSHRGITSFFNWSKGTS